MKTTSSERKGARPASKPIIDEHDHGGLAQAVVEQTKARRRRKPKPRPRRT